MKGREIMLGSNIVREILKPGYFRCKRIVPSWELLETKYTILDIDAIARDRLWNCVGKLMQEKFPVERCDSNSEDRQVDGIEYSVEGYLFSTHEIDQLIHKIIEEVNCGHGDF
jgi:hypothetical protein